MTRTVARAPLSPGSTCCLLTEARQAHSVATIRVDKRGMYGSAGVGDSHAVKHADHAADAPAWVGKAKAETGRPYGMAGGVFDVENWNTKWLCVSTVTASRNFTSSSE